MHTNGDSDPLFAVVTAAEAAQLWRLSRNAVSYACRRGAVRARRSGHTWLLTLRDMLEYQKGRYWPDAIPEPLQAAFERALAQMDGSD